MYQEIGRPLQPHGCMAHLHYPNGYYASAPPANLHGKCKQFRGTPVTAGVSFAPRDSSSSFYYSQAWS